ncbi:hypothetical protein CJP16_18355 [Aeromonas sobria]|uniref:Uncharacterized protein n=1 Tax=Aeromonas sobria TaxID=646 RepID=A0A2N3IQH6_AERSO|nr:hypothetical protein [Aeromonas sobria]PKQ73768.1 hypothetical protein CJP16_18355 [Aeromonas sobria]
MLLLRTYNKWAKNRTVPVSFNNHINHPIDTTLFHQAAHTEIMTNGFKVSPLKIIHAASIHYSGRFGSNSHMKFINAFIEIFTSVEPYDATGLLYFNKSENSEFQGRSSEAIAVGLCISLSEKLFNVNRSRIGLINGSGKRCDFSLIKDGLEYFIESKGRKNNIKSAIKDVFVKKTHYAAISPKYGFISRIPRGKKQTTIEVVDPEFTPNEISRSELIRRLLVHYTKVAALAGFWRLSDQLESRATAIYKGTEITELENRQLDYENILKLGNSITINYGENDFNIFLPNEVRSVFKKDFDGNVALFPMEQSLIEILNNQDYESLINYNLLKEEPREGVNLSVSTDGSVLIMASREEVQDAIR